MIYAFDITTPANTPSSSKKQTILTLHPGLIHQVHVDFRKGNSHLVYVQICRGVRQIWPSNPESNFSGDRQTIAFAEEFYLVEPPYQLEVYTWNVDDTFSHTCTVRIGLLRGGRFI